MTKKLGAIVVLIGVLFGFSLNVPAVPFAAEPAAIDVSPVAIDLQMGKSTVVKAFVYDANGKALTGQNVGWIPGVYATCVTVDQNGTVTATHTGKCKISAFVVSGSGRLVVSRCPIAVSVTDAD
jgi:hypothetical protein